MTLKRETIFMTLERTYAFLTAYKNQIKKILSFSENNRQRDVGRRHQINSGSSEY